MKNLAIATLAALTLIFAGCSEAKTAMTADGVTKQLTDMFGKLTKAADNVKDETTAKAANKTIGGLADSMKGVLAGAKKALPKDGMAKIMKMITDKSGPLLAKLKGLTKFKDMLKPAIDKLMALAK